MRSLSNSNSKERKIKETQIGKEKVNLSLFADGIYIKIPKEFTKNLLEIVN